MDRRLYALLALAAALTVVSAASARNPLDEQRKLTRADNALAASVVLRPTDLPAGFTKKPVAKHDDATCGNQPDLSRFTITGEAERIYSHQSGLSAVVSADVFRSRSEASADFAASSVQAVMQCLRNTLNSEGMTVTKSSYTRNLRIGDRSLHVGVDAQAKSIPIHVDLYAALEGRVQIVFMTFAPVRAPAGQEILLRLMAMRAAKAPAA